MYSITKNFGQSQLSYKNIELISEYKYHIIKFCVIVIFELMAGK